MIIDSPKTDTCVYIVWAAEPQEVLAQQGFEQPYTTKYRQLQGDLCDCVGDACHLCKC